MEDAGLCVPPPPYAFRAGTAKLLLELGLHDEAISVLQELLGEDDEVVAVWYLLGWALHLAGDQPAAREALEKVLHCLHSPRPPHPKTVC